MKTNDLYFRLDLFDGNTNTTEDPGLSGEMRKFYSDYLIDQASPKLVHDQFGQKRAIPKNGGKTIEFRRFSPLPKITASLREGVTPEGQKLNVSVVSATVEQYGGYIELSDVLLMTAIDNNLVSAMKLLGSQAGRTLDTMTREVLCGGTNVLFSGGKSARYELSGGAQSGNCYLTVDDVKRAVRYLKSMNAEKFGDSYVAIINQDCAYDLMNDPDWKAPHTYANAENTYSGEIGKIAGCRFIETSEAKIFHAPDLLCADGETAPVRNLTAASSSSSGTKTVTVTEDMTAAQAQALVGRKVIIGNYLYTVESVASKVLTLTENLAAAVAANDVLYPGEAGDKGRDVYATLILGENAYGTTEIAGEGLSHIVKQLGSAGTADPLNQRATVGWKASKVAKRLVEEYMVRVESCSTFNDGNAN
ncbi:MAG: N4-gp56 family major capsid protein [Clostridia bacterium]|nr:N4-gp56 family major capsid protein [Clostridia bacterium]